MLKRFFASPLVGAAGYVVTLVWDAFWLVGPPMGLATREDQFQFLSWGLLALLICGVQAFWALRRENAELRVLSDRSARLRQARERIGRVLEQLSANERDAYHGTEASDYRKLMDNIEKHRLAGSTPRAVIYSPYGWPYRLE